MPPHWLLSLRNRHFFVIDFVILCLTPVLALLLRVDSPSVWLQFANGLIVYIPVALVTRLVTFRRLGLYGRYWRYASVEELTQIVLAVAVSSTMIVLLFFGIRIPALAMCQAFPITCALPRSIPFIDALLVLLAVGGVRFSVRSAELWLYRGRPDLVTQRVLIVGAGDAGTLIVKELRANPQVGQDPIGFVDDDPHKQGMRIHNLPVLGTRSDIPRLAEEHRIDQVIIAMPTAPGKVIRDIVRICEEAGVPTKTMPGMYELLGGDVSVNQLRDVEIEDLLRREPIQTDIAAVRELIRNRRVLITGGGGSIGGELARQVLRCGPSQLIIVGHGENSVFDIHDELKGKSRGLEAGDEAMPQLAGAERTGNGEQRRATNFPGTQSPAPYPQSPIPITPLIADVRFPERLTAIFQAYRPEIVFHAAAHKHVPLMEQNPTEAVTNNVLGTRNVLRAALAANVDHFVMISTDKAVNPTSIMGATKRTAELLVHEAARASGKPYVAVRFGNVLGSRGSVVLTFKRQIAAGGPVTVTHPEMTRYFMTIPEAVQLVLQAAALGEGGEVFVLDMGEPVKIVDLAQDLIELSGLEVGRDIDIVFTGMRPGEKLFEELFIPGENYHRTQHEKIFIAGNASSFVPQNLDEIVDVLAAAAQRNDRDVIVRTLQGLIPEYRPRTAEPAQPKESPPTEDTTRSEIKPSPLGTAYVP